MPDDSGADGVDAVAGIRRYRPDSAATAMHGRAISEFLSRKFLALASFASDTTRKYNAFVVVRQIYSRLLPNDYAAAVSKDDARAAISNEQIAKRLRSEREAAEFSLAELARETGVPRDSLINYEHRRAALSFDAALRVCRRLDLNQQWLALGTGTKRPFIPLEELNGLTADAISVAKRASFRDAYPSIAKSVRSWLKAHPRRLLIDQNLGAGPNADVRRMSRSRLEAFASEWVSLLRTAENAQMKLAAISNLELALAELRRRLR